MAARTSERRSTPAPRADVERMSRGSSHVVTYQLSDDEIIKYRALPLPPEALAKQRKAAEREERRKAKQERQEKDMPIEKEGPACGLTKQALIEAVAQGESLSSIERAWGMKYNAIHVWVKKWGLKGIKPEQAKAMLKGDVSQSAESQSLTPEQEEAARKLFDAAPTVSEDANSAAAAAQLVEEGAQKDAEIERLNQAMEGAAVIANQAGGRIAELEDQLFAERNEAFALTQQKQARIRELEGQLAAAEADRLTLLETIEHAVVQEEGIVKPSHFVAIGKAMGELVDQKNAAYGDSFAKSGAFLRLLYPNGIQPEQYGDALCLVRIFDKQMRIATYKDAFGESPYRDIIGYGILGAAKEVQAG